MHRGGRWSGEGRGRKQHNQHPLAGQGWLGVRKVDKCKTLEAERRLDTGHVGPPRSGEGLFNSRAIESVRWLHLPMAGFWCRELTSLCVLHRVRTEEQVGAGGPMRRTSRPADVRMRGGGRHPILRAASCSSGREGEDRPWGRRRLANSSCNLKTE